MNLKQAEAQMGRAILRQYKRRKLIERIGPSVKSASDLIKAALPTLEEAAAAITTIRSKGTKPK